MIFLITYFIGVVLSGWVWYAIYSHDKKDSIYSSNLNEYSIDVFKLIKFIALSITSWFGFLMGCISADIDQIPIGTKIKIKK